MPDSSSLALLVRREASFADIAAHLDALDEKERIEQARRLVGRDQEFLWRIAKGSGSLRLESFADVVETTLIYEGKNILPVFNLFQKRFWRTAEGRVFGYNQNSDFVTFFAGPGYFSVFSADDGELAFDYTTVPDRAPPEWPPLRANSGLIPGIVYGGMVDYVRCLSRHTVIGAAFKGGKPRHQYFVLTRFEGASQAPRPPAA